MIGRSVERGSGISVLPARDDDDDDDIYIYIYCHPQTDCFVLSELFSVVRHAGHSKPGSKPVQVYVRLSFRQFLRQSAQPPWGSVYIVIHRQTVLFYQNSSVWPDTQDARNPSNFTLD